MQVIMEVDAVCAEKNISQKDDNDVEMRTAPDVPDLSSRGSFHVSIPMKTTNNVDTNVNCNITLQDISSPKSSSKVNCLEYGIQIGTNQFNSFTQVCKGTRAVFEVLSITEAANSHGVTTVS